MLDAILCSAAHISAVPIDRDTRLPKKRHAPGCAGRRQRGPLTSRCISATFSSIKLNCAPTFAVTGRSYLQTYGNQQANTLKALIPSHVPGATSDLIAAFTCAGSSLKPYESGHDARQLIDQHLPSCKAMFLQNLPLFHPEVCAAFVDGLGYSHMSFEPPGAGRAKIGALDAATTIPGNLLLDLHNELSYNPKPVNKILLLCLEAAEQGGENLLGRNADVTNYLAPATLHTFEQKGGVRYVRRYHAPNSEPKYAMSWQERTGYSTPDAAAQHWLDLGFQEVSFATDGSLIVANTQPACIQQRNGTEVFFNMARIAAAGAPRDLLPFQVTYGNGQPIEQAILDDILQAQWRAT